LRFKAAIHWVWARCGRAGWIWVPAALMLAGFWLHEHDARVRESVALQQQKRQTNLQVGRLERRAASEVRAANQQNAQAVRHLEAERQKLMARDRKLSARLADLEASERAQVGRIATLPIGEVERQVEQRLGAGSGRRAGLHQEPQGRRAGLALQLTDAGARKVDEALVELDACRAERANETGQVSNCAARAAADEAALRRQAGSISELNQALKTKQQAWRAREAESQAELRAARGTFLGRLARTSEHVAIGVGIGIVVGMAVR
jgi:hypothetical protein